jgi:hypothetical protein
MLFCFAIKVFEQQVEGSSFINPLFDFIGFVYNWPFINVGRRPDRFSTDGHTAFLSRAYDTGMIVANDMG